MEEPEALGFAVDELEELALANLARLHVPGRFAEVEPGVWRAVFDDAFAAERMLLPGLLDEVAFVGEKALFLPADDTLLVASTDDAHALGRAFALAAARAEGPGGLLDFAFVLRGGEWAPFAGDGTSAAETQELRVLHHLGPAYAIQNELLALRSDAPPRADFRVHATIGLSMTPWTKGERLWLPRASVLELDDGTGERVPANWQDALDAGARLERVPDVWPELWETKQFPPAEGIAALRRALDARPPLRGTRRLSGAWLFALAVLAALGLALSLR